MTVIMCAVSDERSLTRLRAMPDLVDKVRQEIAARLEELRPLARDASDLQRALDALDGVALTAADDGGRRRSASPGLFEHCPGSRGDRSQISDAMMKHGEVAGHVPQVHCLRKVLWLVTRRGIGLDELDAGNEVR
jgi:hypothetical protein